VRNKGWAKVEEFVDGSFVFGLWFVVPMGFWFAAELLGRRDASNSA
jgi:hypothetical protein